MSYGEQQKKEIETIRERNITVKLSDADCDRLARMCGEHGLTVGELIENFVGDLVGGTYSNGSDERDYANRWFERCWFGMFPKPTLLNHLLCWGYEPEDYLDILDNIETAQEEKKYLEEHPEEADEEAQYIDDDVADWEEKLKDMRADWKPEKEPNMDEEIELIKKWVKEREDEKMKISGAKTIAEYKEIRDKKIQKWIDDNFVEGAVEWEMNGANAIKITDKTGDSMVVQLKDID